MVESLGAEAERSERRRGESGDDWVVGPTFSLELPMFDQNQAQASKAGYELEQAKRRYESLYFAVAVQIRSALDDSATARKTVAFYREQLLPQAGTKPDLCPRCLRRRAGQHSRKCGGTANLTRCATESACRTAPFGRGAVRVGGSRRSACLRIGIKG